MGAVELVKAHDQVPGAGDPPTRCQENWLDADGRVQFCAALLGPELRCSVCAGRRCYSDCRSVDHLPGTELYTEGDCGEGGRYRYRIVKGDDATGVTVYFGHLADMSKGRVMVYIEGADADAVFRDLFYAADAATETTRNRKEPLRLVPRALPADPREPDCSEVDALNLETYAGDDPFSYATALAADQTGGKERQQLRTRVANLLQTHLLNVEHHWTELLRAPDETGEPAARAKVIRDAELCDLFAALAEVLR